jgi:hypothetical protein
MGGYYPLGDCKRIDTSKQGRFYATKKMRGCSRAETVTLTTAHFLLVPRSVDDPVLQSRLQCR